MIGICLVAGLLSAPLGEAVTLRWTHSIEKTVWEEDYQLKGNALLLSEARIHATGAGMEPPDNAEFRNGTWHYRPKLPLLPRIALRHSPHVPPYILCNDSGCRPAPVWLPGLADNAIIELVPCNMSPTIAPDPHTGQPPKAASAG